MSWGSTRAWREIRRAVLARDAGEGWGCRAHDEGWCTSEGVGVHVCTSLPSHVHHTLGVARTGHDMRYMVASCRTCNQAIGEPGRRGDPPNVGVTRW